MNRDWRFFNGGIDEVRLWNRALDATELQSGICTSPLGGEGLIGY